MSEYSYSHTQVALAGLKYELENHIKIEISRIEAHNDMSYIQRIDNQRLTELYRVKQYIEQRCKILEQNEL